MLKAIRSNAWRAGLLAGAVFAYQAQALAQAPATDATQASGAGNPTTTVTVEGKRAKPKAAPRVLRLDPNSSTSCSFFSGGGGGDTYVQDYIAATTGSTDPDVLNQGSVVYNDDGTTSIDTSGTYFSENSPYGDVSTGLNTSTLPGQATSDGAGYCPGAERAVAAARARIARRDKTLPEAYALFDAKKYPEALEMAKKAFNKLTEAQGGDEAALLIGKIYLNGYGVKVDVPEAIKWLQIPAAMRFDASRQMPPFNPKFPDDSLTPISEAAIMLAKVHLTGFGVPKNPKEARKWFERANYVGYVPAAKTLGDMYYYGYDTPRDLKKAMTYYKEAATVGFGPAQYALAEIYYYGEDDTPADLKMAAAWYFEAAKAQHPGALFAVGRAYDMGEGTTADPDKALVFYKDAALKSNRDAQNAMGTYFYQGGQGIAKDDLAARKWFEAAARQGQVDAMFNLGVMLTKGEGGPADPVTAWVWFKLAQSQGHENASAAVAALEKRMTDTDKTKALAILTPAKTN